MIRRREGRRVKRGVCRRKKKYQHPEKCGEKNREEKERKKKDEIEKRT